jgi:hypothetical protein
METRFRLRPASRRSARNSTHIQESVRGPSLTQTEWMRLQPTQSATSIRTAPNVGEGNGCSTCPSTAQQESRGRLCKLAARIFSTNNSYNKSEKNQLNTKTAPTMTPDYRQHRRGAWNGRRGRFFRIPSKRICASLLAVDSESDGHSRRFSSRTSKGQGFVEFALIFPLLLAIIVGISEFGRLMVTYSSVATASRDAARYGASVGETPSGVAHYRDCLGIRETVDRLNLFLDASIVIMYDVDGPGGSPPVEYCQVGKSFDPIEVPLGTQINVTVTGTYKPLTIWPIFELPSIPIASDTKRTILKDMYIK